MGLKTYEQFIKAHNGKAADYDGVAGAQCVDLTKFYLKEVFGIEPGAWGDAHCRLSRARPLSTTTRARPLRLSRKRCTLSTNHSEEMIT